ncbi:MAG: hypothetical protein HY298_13945 [Verrucomicrobia bacterium]|nr:hypothetical protein [Verrucomicrobiota bacterium]
MLESTSHSGQVDFPVDHPRAEAGVVLWMANSKRRIGLQNRLAILKDAARMPFNSME